MQQQKKTENFIFFASTIPVDGQERCQGAICICKSAEACITPPPPPLLTKKYSYQPVLASTGVLSAETPSL